MGRNRGLHQFRVLANKEVRSLFEPVVGSSSQLQDELEPASPSNALKRKVDDAELTSNAQANKKILRTLALSDEKTDYTKETVPSELRKYWEQRYRLFSRFDEGVRMDKEGWWSVTPEAIAEQIAERCRCETVVDAFCGVGGNSIQLALTCERVIAIDTSATRLACAAHNATIYGVADRIQFIQADFMEWAKEYSSQPSSAAHPKIDVLFASPPWGGIAYIADSPSKAPNKAPEFPLDSLLPISGSELYKTCKTLTNEIALFLPRNTSVDELAALEPDSTVEIEEEWTGQKLKAVTVYFGELCNT